MRVYYRALKLFLLWIALSFYFIESLFLKLAIKPIKIIVHIQTL